MSPHRRAIKRLRARLGRRVVVRRVAGLWRVREARFGLFGGPVIAWATTRRGAIDLAAEMGRAA